LLKKKAEFIKKFDGDFVQGFVADGADVVPEEIAP
jgi:hypothetical protein